METWGSLIAAAAAALSSTGVDDPRRQARRLIAAALAISPADLFGDPDHSVDEQQILRLRTMLDRMVAHEPLSRILGRREFWGLDFTLSAETLDPRPETETVVEAVLRRRPDRQAPLRLLDLGTGTGCILIALLNEFSTAIGFGIDIVPAAVRTAVYNAATLGFAERALFFVGDWAAAVLGSFDVIVANPPYIESRKLSLLPREVARYDPRRALDGGEDGLTPFRAIGVALSRLLASDGIFVAEVGVDQADAVAAIMKADGLALDGIEKDLAGSMRCVIARRAEIGIRSKKGLEYSPVPSRVEGLGGTAPRRSGDTH
jgi:release factor glutamine methyltransferase